MRRLHQSVLATVVLVMSSASPSVAQDHTRVYVGGLFGVSTLSGDARSITTPASAMASMYKPENGPTLNVFGGIHLWRFFTLQGNYLWSENDVTLFSSRTAETGGAFYEQPRTSSQHTVVADGLLYFRARGSRVRPYLGTGLAIVRFRSRGSTRGIANGIAPPSGDIEDTRVALRSHVGIDLALGPRWSFRYSFSETIGGNPISPHLMPPGERGLANFQNLFGALWHF